MEGELYIKTILELEAEAAKKRIHCFYINGSHSAYMFTLSGEDFFIERGFFGGEISFAQFLQRLF